MVLILLTIFLLNDGVLLEDQFEQSHHYQKNCKYLVLALDRKGGKVLEQWLKEKPEGYLSQYQVQVVMDKSEIPRFIFRRFILSSLKKYNNPILITGNRQLANEFGRKGDHLTLVLLDELGEVDRIEFVKQVSKLDDLFHQ